MKKNILCLIGVAFLAACSNDGIQEMEMEMFPVTKAVQMDTSSYIDYVTEITALQNVEIRARVKGYLEKFHVDEGAYVKEGQLLFTINNREYAEELAKAKAAYKSAVFKVNTAEIDYKNALQLSKNKIVSPTEVELAKNKLEAEKANLEEALAHQSHAKIMLENTRIKAPFSGVINRIPHKIGSLIDEGTLLTSISQNDQIHAYFDVSEKEYLSYARSLANDSVSSKIVTLILADGREHSCKGVIETMEGQISENTGTIAFRALFDNPNKILKHGASGKIRLQRKFENVIVIPQKATYEIQDKLYVYLLNKNNELVVRNIEISARLPHFFIVTKGLKKGDRILFEGIQNVKSGMKIRPRFVSMKSIISEHNKTN